MLNDLIDTYGFGMPEIFPGDVIPDVLYDGNTVAWFLSDELATLTRDGANRVSRWNDFLGSGHDLIQANGADQPLWSVNGILFDGVSEFMKCAPFVYIQPEMIYMVLRQVTWTATNRIFDGNATGGGAFVQWTATPTTKIFAGALGADNNNLAVNTWGIARILFDGVASKLQINETAPIVGGVGAANMGGFTLGSIGAGTGSWTNIEVKEIILRNVVDGAVDQAAIYDYMISHNGL